MTSKGLPVEFVNFSATSMLDIAAANTTETVRGVVTSSAFSPTDSSSSSPRSSHSLSSPTPQLPVTTDFDWTTFEYNDTLWSEPPPDADAKNSSLSSLDLLLSVYPYPSFYSWTHIIASSATVTVVMLAIVFGNALVVAAIAVDRNLRGTQNWFVASLAVSDLLVGLFIMPLTLTNELVGYWPFGDVVCELWLSTDVLLCTASILNLCLISIDRYLSITRPIAYVRARTPSRSAVAISVVFNAARV